MRIFAVLLLLVALAEGRVLQQAHSKIDALNAQVAGLAAHDAIAEAVANGGQGTAAATHKSIHYAKLANTDAAEFEFDDAGAKRHLLQTGASYQRSDKIQMAAMAAQEAIGKAVAAGGRTTGAATKKGMDYARMVNTGSVQPYMFDDAGVKRHLLQSSASYQRSDKIQMAAMAAQEAIGKAVASAGRTTGAATKKGMDYAQMVNTGSVQPYMFGDAGAKR